MRAGAREIRRIISCGRWSRTDRDQKKKNIPLAPAVGEGSQFRGGSKPSIIVEGGRLGYKQRLSMGEIERSTKATFGEK